MKHSEILKSAIKRLDKDMFLCFSIGNYGSKKHNYLRKWISDLIYPHKTLEDHIDIENDKLHREHHLSQKEYMRRLRVKWAKWMIQELEKDGM